MQEYEVIEGTAGTECTEKRWEGDGRWEYEVVQGIEGRSMKSLREPCVQSVQKKGERVMAGRSIEVIEGTVGTECTEERREGDGRQEYEVVEEMAGMECTEERWEEGQWGRMRKRLKVKGMAGRWEGEWVIDLGCHVFINQRKGLLSTLGEQTSGRDKAGVEVRLVWAWIELKDMANVN
jgi:hypothetical protein